MANSQSAAADERSIVPGVDLLEFSRDREQHQRARRTAHKTHPDAIRPGLASSLNNLSASLADLGRGRTRWPPSRRPAQVYRNWPPGGPMPTTSWNNRCDLLTGSSTVKATHPPRESKT